MKTKVNILKTKSYKRAEESIYGWYTHLNEVLGVLAITLAFSALGSSITAELATFSLILITVLGLTKANEFQVKENQNIFEKAWGKFLSNIISIWKTKIFMIGLLILTFTATGHITQDKVKGFSIQNAFTKLFDSDEEA